VLWQVKVTTSQVKNKLFIGNLPKSMTKEQIKAALDAKVVGEYP
jgi:RNA recognition motif-containing protein